MGQRVRSVPAELAGDGVDRGQVGRVEVADQAGVEVLSIEVDLQAAEAVLHDARLVVRHLLGAIGHHPGAGVLDHGLVVARVGVGQGEGRGREPVKQGLLGADVGVEIPW